MAPKPSDDVDRLYGLPLSEFVAARTELAKKLKEEGHDEAAAEVAALRKPTIAVWAVNQLARRERRDVDLLLDAGHRLRAAHKERNAEKAREASEGAGEAQRDAIRRLNVAAEKLLEEQGSASRATLDKVSATLRAAAITEEGRELLARGRLTEELTTTGFDLVAQLGLPERRSTPAAKKDAAVADARAAVKEAKAREQESSRRLRDAERKAADARRALDAAESELEAARSDADVAADAVADAEDALKRARG